MARGLSTTDQRLLWSRMRKPAFTLLALLVLLGIIVVLGAWLPFRTVWIVEAAVTLAMVAIVLMVSMELPSEPPIIRFFALIGFFWVAILFTMTLLDYLSR
jgi:cytochrome c oxidase subunit 4